MQAFMAVFMGTAIVAFLCWGYYDVVHLGLSWQVWTGKVEHFQDGVMVPLAIVIVLPMLVVGARSVWINWRSSRRTRDTSVTEPEAQ